MALNLFSFFHLNLAYSAIEEEDRPKIIERCYWPLLKLASKHNLPFGIELSGYTLEIIKKIDSNWVDKFRELITEGSCELIGCGYAQIIGPLVPSKITDFNLQIGHEVYRKILGKTPKTALLNEQAFSSGLISLYKSAGYENIIMEWDNPYREHPEWNSEWSYLPQRAKDSNNEEIDLIWNKSIGFQKFQRYAHGELDLEELLDYVRSQRSEKSRAYPVYGNDIEIFDFRPGRYMTEASIQSQGEWKRINNFYEALKNENDMQFIKPSEVMNLKDKPGANQLLDLASEAQPIPVKKQDKYNVLRWAVTGRDDLAINTRCWKLYEALQNNPNSSTVEWKELCYLWSSHFRTHITDKRWKKYKQRINKFSQQHIKANNQNTTNIKNKNNDYLSTNLDFEIIREGRFLVIENKRFKIKLNCKRGLALDSYIDRKISDESLFGTIDHGYFDDIQYSADYYSGHLIFEAPGKHKITDLNNVEPDIMNLPNGIQVSAVIITPLGAIIKKWTIDRITGTLLLSFKLNWSKPLIGSMRLGYITLMPKAFDPKTLSYHAHNGGNCIENFQMGNENNFNHGNTISSLISANQALGVTSGIIEIGDNKKRVTLSYSKSQASLIGLVSYTKVRDLIFSRIALSAREVDDTSRSSPLGPFEVDFKISIT